MPLGVWWLTYALRPTDLIGGAALPWSQALVWGDRALAGESIYYHRAAWQLGSVWGDRLLWGDDVGSVLGGRLIWGDDRGDVFSGGILGH